MEKISPFKTIKEYFLEKYGVGVFKISLDAGLTCPNRDGTKGAGGCSYCDGTGSGSGAAAKGLSVSQQMKAGMEFFRTRRNAQKFLAYFQAFSNTYAPLEKLKALYDAALNFPEVVGLSVGTRADCVDDKIMELLAGYQEKYEVWLELGLQSAHDETLKKINRGQTVADFERAVRLAHEKTIPVCAHVILGLPGETREMMLATARFLKNLKISGIKIHPLMIKKGTPLEILFLAGQLRPLELEEYARLAADFLKELGPEPVIERITGEDYSGRLLAPEFCHKKNQVVEAVYRHLAGKIGQPAG